MLIPSQSDEPNSPESLELPKINTKSHLKLSKSVSPVRRQEPLDSNLPVPTVPSHRVKTLRTNIHHPITSNLSRQLRLRGRDKSTKNSTTNSVPQNKDNENANGDCTSMSSTSPTRKENPSVEVKKKSPMKNFNKRSKQFLRHKSSDPRSEEGSELSVSSKNDPPTINEFAEKVPEPCTSCGRNDLPERLHTHHLVESKVKKESSKIPIRLDSPPKRMETLAEQQVISISRVKTSPSKRSKKHDLSKSSNVYHNDPMEDAEYSKSTGENILNIAGSVGSTMKNWMSPKQKRKHRKSKVKRSLSLEIKDLFMGFVHNGSSSSNLLESKKKHKEERSPSPTPKDETDVPSKRSTSFSSLIPTNIRLHTGRKNKSLLRPVSTTSLTTIKLVEFTSSATDDEENVECDVTDVEEKRQTQVNSKLGDKEASNEKSFDDDESVISSLTQIGSSDTTNTANQDLTDQPSDKNVKAELDVSNIDRLSRKDYKPKKGEKSERSKGFRFVNRERKRRKHRNDDKEQVGEKIT